MNFNVIYDSSVAGAPVGFTTVVQSAVTFLKSQFTDNFTFNLHVGYGEVHGTALGAGSLGQSSYLLNTYTYAQIRAALIGDSRSNDDATAVSTLPASDPAGGAHDWWVAQAEQVALGLASGTFDGYVGFADTAHATFDYNSLDGIAAGQYDFFGTVMHEVTEVMGRQLGVGEDQIGGDGRSDRYALDLFHYSSTGTRDLSARGGYFSYDNGVTHRGDFNTSAGGDAGDWGGSTVRDSYLAFSGSGVINQVSADDLRVMDVLGYDRAGSRNDFGGDRNADILWRNDNGQVATWDMNDHAFTGFNFGTLGNDWHVAGTGDFNGDGKSDIVWRHDSGQVATWDMDDHTFSGFNFGVLGNDWHIAGTGDFNGDRKTDILWRHDSGQVATWDMNDHTFSGFNFGTVGNDWHVAGTGDFNGDGKADILWRHDSGQVATWDMNDHSFTGFNFGVVGNDWHVAGTGDVNTDGNSDILWRNDNGQVTIWYMNDHNVTAINIGVLGNDWHFADTGDFNGDGRADILWRNDNGQVATWDMKGDHSFTGFNFGTVGNDWHIMA
jgi:hypothetical protein